jgi:hypothetical protein
LELYEAVSAYLGSTSPILKTLGDYYQAREFTDAALACHIMRCVTEQVQPTTRPFVNPLTERPGPLVVAPIPEVGQVQPPEKSTFLTWGDGSELGTPRILYCPVKPGGPGILELWYRYRDRWRYFGYVDKQEEADRITGGASGKKARACVSVEPERGDVSAVILLRDRADNLWHLISSQLRVKWDAYPGTTP